MPFLLKVICKVGGNYLYERNLISLVVFYSLQDKLHFQNVRLKL